MGTVSIVSALLILLSGIGIFLIACQMMSSNLESASSRRLKQMFAKTSSNKLAGVGIGAAATALIQSSGATTVMTIGFVNAGIITLFQAATIIYGANIGTTITAQIVALGMFGKSTLSTTLIFSALTGIGAFMMMFSKKARLKTLGGIIAGFGMLFVGLSLMSGSMETFAAQDSVKSFLARIENPILLVIVGALLTAIIQSSSVMTTIALAMVVSGLISLDQGIMLTLGSNIGSCVVAVLAGISGGRNARRTALIHLLFNCSGVIIFLLASWIMSLFSSGSVSLGTMFSKAFPGAPQTQLAMFHTFFNTVTVIIMLPLTSALVNTVKRLIPDSEQDNATDEGFRLHYLNDNILRNAPVAVGYVKKEILRMADLAKENTNNAIDAITTLDFSHLNGFKKKEEELDFINKALVEYVVMLSSGSGLSQKDKIYLSTTFRTVRDIERIGDYAENITEYAYNLSNSSQHFSQMAKKEIAELKEKLNTLYDKAIDAYSNEDFEALAQANILEEEIDDIKEKMEENHIQRLSQGICTPTVGAQYLSLSSNAERIADHLINVAKSIRNLKD
ncbi:MAG: Na/Pi cotransporter family protein [Bacteroidales bacterium]|nr:Na/Pi cotransporter family protein [Bacteroidales bacterium]